MRILHNLQIAIRVIDGYSMLPLNSSTIVDTSPRHNPIVKKGNGEYVYLTDDNANFSINCQGYTPKTLEHNRNDEKGKNVIIKLYHNASSSALFSIPHIQMVMKHDGQYLSNQEFTITLVSKVSALRVTQNAQKGDEGLFLNSEYNKSLVYCECRYKNDIFMIDDYDKEAGEYMISSGIPKDIKASELLSPVWKINSDKNGNIIFPIDYFFMENPEINLSIDDKFTVSVIPTEHRTIIEVEMP